MKEENKKEKPTIKESFQRIILTLSMMNMFIGFPLAFEGVGLSIMFKEEEFVGNYKNNVAILIIYGIISLVTTIVFFLDRKNKGKNLIRNLSIILIFISLSLIIYGIIFNKIF